MIIAIQKCLKKHNKISKYIHGQKCVNVPFIVYTDLECLLKNIVVCHNNPKKSSTAKKISMNLLVIHCLHVVHLMLRKINFECYRGKDCIKNFCKDLKEHVLEIINYEKKRKDAINT